GSDVCSSDLDIFMLRKLPLFASILGLTASCATDPATQTKSVSQMLCPAPGTFDNAVCACDDLAHVGELHVLPGPGGTGSIGVNGKSVLVAFAEVSGTWNAWGGFT